MDNSTATAQNPPAAPASQTPDHIPPRKIGRPRLYPTPESFADALNDYFAACDLNRVKTIYDKQGNVIESIREPYTICGMQDHLGLSREGWSEYRERPDYGDMIKKAELAVERDCVVGGQTGKFNPIMSIFLLKCKFGYRETMTLEVTEKLDDREVEGRIKMLLDKMQEAAK